MDWTARRIVKDLADGERRKRIATAFWKYADPTAKAIAVAQLARMLHFREDTLRKLPAEKKAELLVSRAGSPELEQTLETALMLYHTHEANTMLAAFLDRWAIPHNNGSIEIEDYRTPSSDEVRRAVEQLDSFDPRDVAIYLAAAGLLMAGDWRNAAWPMAEELATSLAGA